MSTYPMTPEDAEIQRRARAFVDEELIPWEQRAEEHVHEALGIRVELGKLSLGVPLAEDQQIHLFRGGTVFEDREDLSAWGEDGRIDVG